MRPRFLVGEVRRLTCQTASVRPGIRGEDAATILLVRQDRVMCVVDATYQARQVPEPFPETLIEVDGSAGTLRLRQGYALTVIGRGGTEHRAVAPALLPWASRPWHGVQESVLATQRHWIACLRSGAEPATSGADNLKPPRSARRPMHRPRPAIRSRRASDGPPIDQPQGGEECRPNR